MIEWESVRGFLFALCAGLSTALGAILVVWFNGKGERVISISLGFAAGVMISAAFTDMFPESEEMLTHFFGEGHGVLFAVAMLTAGVLLAWLMDHFLPHSHDGHVHSGAHIHTHGHNHNHNNKGGNAGLLHVGIATAVAIGFHNLPEGIAIFMAGHEDVALGVSVTVAIALHSIPGGISVASPIYYATGSGRKAVLYALLAGLAAPLGALLAWLLLMPFINDAVMGALFGLVAGVLLYIAFVELIPASKGRGYDKEAMIALFVGLILMPLTHIAHAHGHVH